MMQLQWQRYREVRRLQPDSEPGYGALRAAFVQTFPGGCS